MSLEDTGTLPTCHTKEELYAGIADHVKKLISFKSLTMAPYLNLMLSLGNVSAFVFYELNHYANPAATLNYLPVNWFGFYLLHAPRLLVLGPFQGRSACTEIALGRGVCGTAAEKGEPLLVSDVHLFEGHIACDAISRSEIVVPIKDVKGNVVAVIDVDSPQLDFFDKKDLDGLQKVAGVLSECLDFSLLHHGLNENLSLLSITAPTSFATAPAARGAGGRAKMMSLLATKRGESTAAGGESLHVLREPQRWDAELGGWYFLATKLDCMLGLEGVQQYEKELGIRATPEIQFPLNTLVVAPAARRGAPLLSFSLFDMLLSAAAFYKTKEYRNVVLPQLRLPVAETWKKENYATFDAKVDWAWRNNFFGINGQRCSLMPLEPAMPEINWELLKDTALPIIFSHSFDMMEDDLHDNGIVKSSVRIRAMPTAFFILFRHFICIGGYKVWMRDVRIFHEYNEKRSGGEPHIVFCEEVRILDIDLKEKWHGLNPEEYASKATVIEKHNFYLNFDDSTDSEWWNAIGSA